MPVESEKDAPAVTTSEISTDTAPESRSSRADTATDGATTADQPETIPLSIASEPAEVRVEVNGESLGHTPIERAGVRPGTATIVLEKSGYRDWKERIRLDEPTRLTVRLRRIKSSLVLRGTPDTMQITVDGTTVRPGSGKRLELTPGTYPVKARARDREPFDTTVTLEPGATEELTIDLDPIPHVWDYPSTRDVFLRLGRNTLGELVDKFGLETGDRVRLVPARDDPSHALVDDVLSLVMNRKALMVVEEGTPADVRTGDTADASPRKLDGLFTFRVVEMDVDYEEADASGGENRTKRYFTLKLYAKLVNPSGGEVQYSRYFTRTTRDTVPTRFREALEEPYSTAE